MGSDLRPGWLFTLAAAASAVLGCSALLMWPANYLGPSYLQVIVLRQRLALTSEHGSAFLEWQWMDHPWSACALSAGRQPHLMPSGWYRLSLQWLVAAQGGILVDTPSVVTTVVDWNRIPGGRFGIWRISFPFAPFLGSVQDDIYVLSLPWWCLAVLSLPLPLLWWRRRNLPSLYERGLCPQCAYDLRASPDRCPECGRPVTPKRGPDPSELHWPRLALALLLLVLLLFLLFTAFASTGHFETDRGTATGMLGLLLLGMVIAALAMIAYDPRQREDRNMLAVASLVVHAYGVILLAWAGMPWQALAVVSVPLLMWWALRWLGLTQVADRGTVVELAYLTLVLAAPVAQWTLAGFLWLIDPRLGGMALVLSGAALFATGLAMVWRRGRAHGSRLLNVGWCISAGLLTLLLVLLTYG